jgi:hypothetical protein
MRVHLFMEGKMELADSKMTELDTLISWIGEEMLKCFWGELEL